MKVYVTATFSANPGCAAQLQAAAIANIPNVRAEAGCLRYDLHTDGQGNFLWYETWESPEALAAHAASAHMAAYRVATKALVTGPSVVTKWQGLDNS